ncbi:limbic system-associated membrane protein-like [Aethina tumida]|uniref:limbic system-associated membrane protein-like n=1 Tax=Aethina tumida TaxID=116153 RepID=UPI0021477FF6|nr:limbic system-associated membrane protein-like [Aethina tumida]
MHCYSMASTRADLVLVSTCFVLLLCVVPVRPLESPRFSQPISNMTVAMGREAILECLVENLNPYKVAWLRVDTQTILTIHNHVITKNHRIGVTHSEQKTWYLHIREVRESDKGWYMCQINTDPMKSQVGYLNVVVPPDILDYPTSADMVVDEGSDVSLRCVAKGSPEPLITWKREDGHQIHLQTGLDAVSVSGPILNLTKVKRDHMGPYLCIASNGIPPSVSKRIMLIVQFPPSVWIQYQLIGAYDAQQITLECHSEAFPKSINYWTRDKGEIIPHNYKYVPEIIEEGYKVHMKLTINLLGPQDYGIYRCISKNSLGDMEGTINVYRIPNPNKIPAREKSTAKMNDVTYRTQGREKDRADLLFLENEYYSSAHRVSVSRLLIVLWLCVLSNCIFV